MHILLIYVTFKFIVEKYNTLLDCKGEYMFDVLILGGGPAGYKSAEILSKAGKKVAIIEKNKLGGTCLNAGCIPLKTFLHISKSISEINQLQNEQIISDSKYAIFGEEMKYKKDKVVKDIRKGLEYTIKSLDITVFNNYGYILGKNKDEKFEIKLDNDEIVVGSRLIIATGSESIKLNEQDGSYDYKIIDSDAFFELEYIPNTILIIGAGVIGLEIASFYNMLGVKVFVIDMAKHIGGNLDDEIAENLQKNLEKKGIEFRLNTKVKNFNKDCIELFSEKEGEFSYSPEIVLVAIGRKPLVRNTGINNLDILLNENGFISVNEHGETTESGVYACGDVIGGPLLAHVAYHEAKVVSSCILLEQSTISYDTVPGIIYTSPEVASVGMTEKKCKDEGIDYKKVTKSMMYNGRYYLENGRDYAIIKILISNSDNVILGAHMVGNFASEIIILFEDFIVNKKSINDIKKMIFPHPTVGEIIIDALEDI